MIHIKDLTREEREDLKKQLDWYEEKPKTIWDMKDWDSYYVIDFEWDILSYSYDTTYADDVVSTWSSFLTREEAAKELSKRKAIVRINKRIDELNNWWIPDWEYYCQYKYNISYDIDDKYYWVDSAMYKKRGIIIKFMKTEEIAEEIIKEYKNDLDIIFDLT